MKNKLFILTILSFMLCTSKAQEKHTFTFYDASVSFDLNAFSPLLSSSLSQASFENFINDLDKADHSSLINALLNYKEKYKSDDWLYYQLIRRAAEYISPKADNYIRYTLYKWYFLTRSGYDAVLTVSPEKVLFYVKSDELIYNIPYKIKNGVQYVCLNYHDYGSIDFEKEKFTWLNLPSNGSKGFSYKVTHLPDFTNQHLGEKDIRFTYHERVYSFKIKITEEVKTIFRNYPVVDYSSQFNMPLTSNTYNSLIPLLQKQVKEMKLRDGVEFLMSFTRYAFLYKPDIEVFGQEKRLSPEQTLLSEYSDCEDRAALFFYLVKELYNLPMIVLASPTHVTVAVQFDKVYGKGIKYNGNTYSVCEPTPQKYDLRIGQTAPGFSKTGYEVVYAYNPKM